MDSSSDDEFVLLRWSNPKSTESLDGHREIIISAADIDSWDSPALVRYATVKIRAQRSRLVESCSYFRGLLGGSFRESNLNGVSIEWSLEPFVSVLKCVYCSSCSVDVMPRNFLSLLEAAMYFGEETLLLKCKNWISEAELLEVQLDDLIEFWKFGLEHAIDFLSEVSVGYLARKFELMRSSKSFGDVPYALLLSCIKHPDLTIDSEKHLADALLHWVGCNVEPLGSSSKGQNVCSEVLKEIRVCLLPLPFAAGKRRSRYFSALADKSTDTIIRLMKVPPAQMLDALEHAHMGNVRIRLTEYSKKVDLSGCPQINSALLLLSLLPYSYVMEPSLKKSVRETMVSLERFNKNQSQVPQSLLPILSLKAVEEVDISNCPSLHLEAAIECFSISFPCLKKVKASYLLNFKQRTFHKLLEKCLLVDELDLTVDSTPLIPGQVTVMSSSVVTSPSSTFPYARVLDSLFTNSNITRLTLEGRSEIKDLDLQHVSKLCATLHHLNLKGCVSVTDAGISDLLWRCAQLSSLLVCNTSFGLNSVSALCSSTITIATSSDSYTEQRDCPLACKLQALHMGGCKGVNERSLLELISRTNTLRDLCLRDTGLMDTALYSFPGFSLETLDVSNTVISRACLVHIVRANPMLKSLKVRGCRNLIPQEDITRKSELASSYPIVDVYAELGERCMLEEISLGWGFTCSSFQALKPAIASLKSLTIGLGASLSEDTLRQLPITCPMLDVIVLYFQLISDDTIASITTSLRHLQTLALSYCLGDVSVSSFRQSLPHLTNLRLERVTPWMTNDDLAVLTQNCANIRELTLVGCRLLDADSLQAISSGWSGLTSIHLEECGEVTANGVSPLFSCIALEDILLRHNGSGISKDVIVDAASKLPLLRKVSLDLCDAREGDYDIPDYAGRCFLSSVKIARCKSPQKFCANLKSFGKVHKETLALVWNSESLTRAVVKERL
ncbi:unnamed protein product [Linum trigynum]|uniref:BACK domain-containing protein n=1 Tax=Linum trigynum TaxID=586398 RepID=A0AAV2DGN3_9ROSI